MLARTYCTHVPPPHPPACPRTSQAVDARGDPCLLLPGVQPPRRVHQQADLLRGLPLPEGGLKHVRVDCHVASVWLYDGGLVRG